MEPVATAQDRKTGPETAQKAGRIAEPSRSPVRSVPKTHVSFWRARVERRIYTYQGKAVEVPEYSVRMEYGGIRRRLTLGTALKEDAALKARDIYLSLIAKGWSATLAELAPKSTESTVETGAKSGDPTVGDFLLEVQRTSNLKPKTFRRYAQYFRMLAAQIQGVDSDASRYDYRSGGLTAWRERVDSVRLSAITPTGVADWRIGYLKRAGNDPRRKLEVNRSFNAALRHCKSLFSSNIINKANFAVKVPKFKVPDGQKGERDAYWFETVDFEKAGSMKFHSPAGVTYEALVKNARHRTQTRFGRHGLCRCLAHEGIAKFQGPGPARLCGQLNLGVEANHVWSLPLRTALADVDGMVGKQWHLSQKESSRTAKAFRRRHCQAERHLRRERPTPALDNPNDREPLPRPSPTCGPAG